MFDDLKLKAKYYQQIICESNRQGEGISEIDRIFKFMQSNRSLLFRPIYLSLLHQNELGKISEENLVKVLKCIQYFFVCYNLISKETSNKISEGVQKYAFQIENEYSQEVLKYFKNTNRITQTMYTSLQTNPTTSSFGCRVCPT